MYLICHFFAVDVICIVQRRSVPQSVVMVPSKDWPTNHRPAGAIFHPCRRPHQCTSRTPRTLRIEVVKKGEHVLLAASKTENDPDCHAPTFFLLSYLVCSWQSSHRLLEDLNKSRCSNSSYQNTRSNANTSLVGRSVF
jgi:hypothetical protein